MKNRNIVTIQALVILSVMASGCTTREIRYVERPQPQQRQQPSQQHSSNSCKYTYKIFEQCYQLGIGDTTENCAKYTRTIYQKLDLGDRKTEAAVSLFCGIACTQATKREGMNSYTAFSRKYCN